MIDSKKVPAAGGWSEPADSPDELDRLVKLLLEGVDDPLGVDRELVPMILAVLRRPRSHLAYLALLTCPTAATAPRADLPAPAFWDRLLGEAAGDPWPADLPRGYPDGSCYLGGSLVWMPRRVHNRAYSRLTDVGHRVAGGIRAGRRTGPNPAEDHPAVLSLLAAAVLHRRAARYYFSEVYEATGDITAFREYIYHRISYLRSLCRLLVISGQWVGPPERGDLELRRLLARALHNYHFPRTWPDTPVPPWGVIRLGLRDAWQQELKAFRATLSREFEAVRRDLYADTWISILDRVRKFDVEEMFHPASFRIPDHPDDPDGLLCRRELDDLTEDLRRQELERSSRWPTGAAHSPPSACGSRRSRGRSPTPATTSTPSPERFSKTSSVYVLTGITCRGRSSRL